MPQPGQPRPAAPPGPRGPAAPRGPVPRNPDLSLRSDFPRSGDITFTRVPNNGKFIAITYDDGPHPTNTPRLLDMLRERNIKATFYVIGNNVDLRPQIVRRTVEEGHEIGNHSQTHPNLRNLGNDSLRREMDRCRDAIARAAGVRPRTMRPPYGSLSPAQRQLVHAEYGYPTILWSVDPEDWRRPGASVISSRITNNTHSGAIILAHDLHAQTIDAMPSALDHLLREGYRFVTVSQLLAMNAAGSVAQA